MTTLTIIGIVIVSVAAYLAPAGYVCGRFWEYAQETSRQPEFFVSVIFGLLWPVTAAVYFFFYKPFKLSTRPKKADIPEAKVV